MSGGLVLALVGCGGHTVHEEETASAGSAAVVSVGGSAAGGASYTGASYAGVASSSGGAAATGAAGVSGLAGAGACTFGPPNPFQPGAPPFGEFLLNACGTERDCFSGTGSESEHPLPGHIGLSVRPGATPGAAIVMVHGSGELLLDERPFDASIAGRSLTVEVHGPLSKTCAQNYSLSLRYDFDGVGPCELSLDFERLNSCSGNAGASCKGSIRTALGPWSDASTLK